VPRPIASLTKLMTALVVLEAQQPGDELLEITRDDVDTEKRTPSRLKVGTRLSRDELLLLALMASENRSALTLSRHFPGGRRAFVARMNAKARELGMTRTRFVDPAGLRSGNVSPPRDLVKLLEAADSEPLIRDYSTRREYTVRVGKRPMKFGNSNRLIRSRAWSIGLQKTGYTNEAGRCLLMQARVANRRVAMIFLDSFGKLTRYGDASRVRQRLERDGRKRVVAADAS
jgi:D-alanyl-D-alanine endopeptidase (penicillin-binding protein 7)